MKKEPYIFKVGDRVSFGGMKGVVMEFNSELVHPVAVKYDERDFGSGLFTADGRFYTKQTKPVLKRLVKKKLKTITCPWCEKNFTYQWEKRRFEK